jgi:hypothetical protein
LSVIKKMRKQKAIYWQRDVAPNRFGQFTFAAPIEIDCRWDDVIEEFLDPRGETQSSRALVYVDRVMLVGDRLKRGEMDSETPDDPLTIQDAFAIRRFDQNPNFRNTENLLTAFL